MPGFCVPGSSRLRAQAGRATHKATASTPPPPAIRQREVRDFGLSPAIFLCLCWSSSAAVVGSGPATEPVIVCWYAHFIDGVAANSPSLGHVLPFMDTNLLETKFARIGARLKVADRPSRRSRTPGVLSLDVRADSKGEFFEVVRPKGSGAEVAVLDVQPADRHLLLLVREGKDKSKFLCGHDERHWFVAGIPEAAPVGTVRQAKEALKPTEVQTAQARQRLKAKTSSRRKNAAYVRQGEWFFLPVADMAVDETLILRDEPLARGNGGKAHWAESRH